MPSKIANLYADFETTYVDLKGQSPRDFFATHDERPEVYSWCITYTGPELTKDKGTLLEDLNVRFNQIEWDGIMYSRYYGIDVFSFIELTRWFKSDVKIWFNNSKAYDGHYILPRLYDLGMTVYDKRTPIDESDKRIINRRLNNLHNLNKEIPSYQAMDDDEQLEFLKSQWKRFTENDYSALINDSKEIFQIEYGSHTFKKVKGLKVFRKVTIIDNLLIWNMSVKKMGETLAKEWNKPLSLYAKEELSSNYMKTTRYNTLEELENDGNELWYLTKDTLIVNRFHDLMAEHFPRELWRMTAGATAFNLVKRHFLLDNIKECIKEGTFKTVEQAHGGVVYKNPFTKKPTTIRGIQEASWNIFLPLKWLTKEHHDNIYQVYNGGNTQVNEKYRGKVVTNVTVIDKNSSYSGVMNSLNRCPYGVPIIGNTNDPRYDFKIYTMSIRKLIVNKNGLPFLFSQEQSRRYYPKKLLPGTTIRLTTPELMRFRKFYSRNEGIDYVLHVDYSFKTKPFKFFFGNFIDHYYGTKEEASKKGLDALKFVCKVMLNTPYGKMGTKSLRVGFHFIEGEFEKFHEELESKFYLPIAVAITAYGRMCLVDGVGNKFYLFVYDDTDSLFIINFSKSNFPRILLDKYRLGYWDIEATNLVGIVRRTKQYWFVDITTGKTKMAYAGINTGKLYTGTIEDYADSQRKIIDTFELKDFIYGRVIENQINNYKLHGTGVILFDMPKAIKPIWDYKPLPEQNYYLKEHFLTPDVEYWNGKLKEIREKYIASQNAL